MPKISKRKKKKEIGARFRNIRISLGKTQSQIAADLGKVQQQISTWERGIEFVPIEIACKISDLYGKKHAIYLIFG